MDILEKAARSYHRTGSPADQSTVIAEAEIYIQHILQKIDVPSDIRFDYDDLAQEARYMVAKSLELFEPSETNTFSTYMYQRVFGAVIDYIRRLDPLPRPDRFKVGELSDAERRLSQQLGRFPSVAELAEEIDTTPQDIIEAQKAQDYRQQTSLTPDVAAYLGEEDSALETKFAFEEVLELLKTFRTKDRILIVAYDLLHLDGIETAKLLGYKDRMYIYKLRRKILDNVKNLAL